MGKGGWARPRPNRARGVHARWDWKWTSVQRDWKRVGTRTRKGGWARPRPNRVQWVRVRHRRFVVLR